MICKGVDAPCRSWIQSSTSSFQLILRAVHSWPSLLEEYLSHLAPDAASGSSATKELLAMELPKVNETRVDRCST